MCRELRNVESVENALFGYAALAGHEDAPLDVVDFFGRVGVRVDAESLHASHRSLLVVLL
jgi:hypothetical protein